jgi:small-conductance mechanosensitive channel
MAKNLNIDRSHLITTEMFYPHLKGRCSVPLTLVGKLPTCLLLSVFALSLAAIQPVFSQTLPGRNNDSVKAAVSDSLLPTLVLKVASYTATIDHTEFLVQRKFNITPISRNMPEIERKVKGFKTRLQKRGSQMNLRSLNSSVIMLNEISRTLTSYQKVLANFSKELTASNTEVKKILSDPLLYVYVSDSVLLEQLENIRSDGREIDSLQTITLRKVNLLRNRVSINLLQATDIISDTRYLTMSYKLGIWEQEEAPLFRAVPHDYENPTIEVADRALLRSWLIILIYLGGKWNVLTIALMVFIFTLCWNLLNKRRISKQPNAPEVMQPLFFLNHNVLLCCLMAFFTYLPYFFLNPPMSFLHACEALRVVMLSYLVYPYLTRNYKLLLVPFSLLWFLFALDDILLESAFGERWALFFGSILLGAICVKIITEKNRIFLRLPESPASRALAIFSLAQVVLSIIFNLTGRTSLAKICGVSAIQCLMLGLSLKVFCTMALEAIYLQSESFHESRFSEFINFKVLQNRFLRVLWVLAVIVWSVSLMRNLTLYDVMLQFFNSFFNEVRTIGSMVFTFKSVAIFICIIWLSSVISGFISFFFDNKKISDPTNRSRLGSMMLLIRLTIWTLGFCIAVAAAGVPIDRLSLMLGALGVGIGFGLQNIVNNLVSGIILAFERPIQVGDLIEIGGKLGVVKEIGVRSSKINNNAGADIIVPNGDLLSQHLINWTMQNRNKQVDFTLTIPYEAELKEVSKLIKQTLEKNEKIMAVYPAAIVVQEFSDFGINLKISFWVADLNEAGTVRTTAMIEVYEVLRNTGITFPVHKPPADERLIQENHKEPKTLKM